MYTAAKDHYQCFIEKCNTGNFVGWRYDRNLGDVSYDTFSENVRVFVYADTYEENPEEYKNKILESDIPKEIKKRFLSEWDSWIEHRVKHVTA